MGAQIFLHCCPHVPLTLSTEHICAYIYIYTYCVEKHVFSQLVSSKSARSNCRRGSTGVLLSWSYTPNRTVKSTMRAMRWRPCSTLQMYIMIYIYIQHIIYIYIYTIYIIIHIYIYNMYSLCNMYSKYCAGKFVHRKKTGMRCTGNVVQQIFYKKIMYRMILYKNVV